VLASRNRLTASGQFQETVRRGQRAGGPLLVVHLLVPVARTGEVPDALAAPRAGFVVSRAVGPAVTRNQVKRRLRHLVREHLDDLPPGALLVVRALPPAGTAEAAELRAELARCLGKARRAPGRARPGSEARTP
jgi:ribonuclease P protein component